MASNQAVTGNQERCLGQLLIPNVPRWITEARFYRAYWVPTSSTTEVSVESDLRRYRWAANANPPGILSIQAWGVEVGLRAEAAYLNFATPHDLLAYCHAIGQSKIFTARTLETPSHLIKISMFPNQSLN